MRKFIVALLLTGLVWSYGAVAQSPTAPLATFPTEQQAQHCPVDTVVWLNLPSGIYHLKGERWYGNTKSGAYVCQREANHAGDRATQMDNNPGSGRVGLRSDEADMRSAAGVRR